MSRILILIIKLLEQFNQNTANTPFLLIKKFILKECLKKLYKLILIYYQISNFKSYPAIRKDSGAI
jgi:hypothetical protein